MKSLAIGLASGLGNSVFMLPAIKALKLMGYHIALYVQTDFATADLWRRCKYADEILEPPASLNGHRPICGQWRPAAWRDMRGLLRYQIFYPYQQAEWESDMKMARRLGWTSEAPEITDWCRDLNRSRRWDVGIVPGSKGGIWLRKRYPYMAAVARHFIQQMKRVAVIGLEQDGVGEIPGEYIQTSEIERLPDFLAGCGVVIGTDSGPTHLANSLGIPTVVIHSATCRIKATPVCKPYRQVYLEDLPCFPCQSKPQWQQCSDWKCREIDPSRVIQAAEELLNATSGNR